MPLNYVSTILWRQRQLLAKTIVDLQLQEVSYQAALVATARVVQPSLLDFLR